MRYNNNDARPIKILPVMNRGAHTTQLKEGCPVCKKKAFINFKLCRDMGRLVRCPGCGVVYRHPFTSPEELSTIYGSYFKDSEEYKKQMEKWFLDKNGPYQYAINFVNKTGGFSNRSVLEVGCGYGRFLFECRKQGALITGVDSHPQAVSSAKQYYDVDVIDRKIEVAVQQRLLLLGSFDFIFAFEVLEHVREPGVFLSALRELLKPQGLLFLSTPNLQFELLLKTKDQITRDYPEHLLFFEASALKKCFERYNLKPIDIVAVHNYAYAARQKKIIIKSRFVKGIWVRLRKNRYFYAIKDLIFKIVDRHKQQIDREGFNGTHLICIARKQKE